MPSMSSLIVRVLEAADALVAAMEMEGDVDWVPLVTRLHDAVSYYRLGQTFMKQPEEVTHERSMGGMRDLPEEVKQNGSDLEQGGGLGTQA